MKQPTSLRGSLRAPLYTSSPAPTSAGANPSPQSLVRFFLDAPFDRSFRVSALGAICVPHTRFGRLRGPNLHFCRLHSLSFQLRCARSPSFQLRCARSLSLQHRCTRAPDFCLRGFRFHFLRFHSASLGTRGPSSLMFCFCCSRCPRSFGFGCRRPRGRVLGFAGAADSVIAPAPPATPTPGTCARSALCCALAR